jgi:alpha-beta hydrolase superfamily lysophospholipase
MISLSPHPLENSLSLTILRNRGCSADEITKYYTNLRNLRVCIHPGGPWAPFPHESFYHAPDGVPIFVQAFIPPQPRLLVLAQHGNNVQADLFYPLADHLYAQNIGLIAVDNRGHGRSGPDRGHMNHPEYMFPVYDAITADYSRQFPDISWHMLGESLGCTLTAAYVNSLPRRMRQFCSLIFLVPPLRIRIVNQFIRSRFFLGLMKILMTFGILLSLNRPFLHNRQDFRPTYYREYHKIDQKDPIRNPKNSLRHFLTAIELFSQFERNCARITRPLFILEGTADQILDFRGSLELFKIATRAYRKVHIYKGADHSLMMDKNSASIYDELIAWLIKTTDHL